MKRGELVLVAMQGDYGKPRPALVVQADLFNVDAPSVTVAPMSTTILDAPVARITVEPSKTNGLRAKSQVMVDKLNTVPRKRIGPKIGRLEDEALKRVNRALLVWLALPA